MEALLIVFLVVLAIAGKPFLWTALVILVGLLVGVLFWHPADFLFPLIKTGLILFKDCWIVIKHMWNRDVPWYSQGLLWRGFKSRLHMKTRWRGNIQWQKSNENNRDSHNVTSHTHTSKVLNGREMKIKKMCWKKELKNSGNILGIPRADADGRLSEEVRLGGGELDRGRDDRFGLHHPLLQLVGGRPRRGQRGRPSQTSGGHRNRPLLGWTHHPGLNLNFLIFCQCFKNLRIHSSTLGGHYGGSRHSHQIIV